MGTNVLNMRMSVQNVFRVFLALSLAFAVVASGQANSAPCFDDQIERILAQHAAEVAEVSDHGHAHFDDEEIVEDHVLTAHAAELLAQEMPLTWILDADRELIRPQLQPEWGVAHSAGQSIDDDAKERPPRT